MKRRKFIQSSTYTSAFLPFLGTLDFSAWEALPNNFLPVFIEENDKRVQNILNLQQLQKGHPFYGGFPDKYDIYAPARPAAYAQSLVSAFLSPTSDFYHSEKITTCLQLGMDFMLKAQHEDGTIDLLSTNFHSPPDTAFAVEPLGLALTLVRKYDAGQLKTFQQQAETFLKHAGDAMSVGGIHTPNHRWVVCRALSRVYSLFPKKKYLKRIEQWLSEGIDIDPDGQYTEKSSVVYSPITNDSLITTARLLSKDELYEPVRKNLRMTQFMMHANGEVVTEASTRQDQFTIANMGRYFYAYRYMALLDKDPIFSAMAQLIETYVGLTALSGNLPYFLENDDLTKELPQAGKLSTDYTKHFSHSDLLRIRRGQVDATILGDNSIFFTFFKGKAALQGVRMASAFFGKGQFSSPDIKEEKGAYVLTQELRGPYYQPHTKENIATDGDWHKMPRTLRKQSEVQTLRSIISIKESDGKFRLHFSVTGTKHVPLAIELAFRSGGALSGVEKVAETEGAFLLEEGYGEYVFEQDKIRFGPGLKQHSWTQLRGAKAKLNGDSIYLTGYTPFEFELEVE